jgi:hypothetical protein
MANLRAKPELRAVTIALMRDRKEAARVQDKLRRAGIESALADEGSYAPGQPKSRQRRAVKIQVKRADVERALSMLGNLNLAANQASADRKGTGLSARRLLAGNPVVATIGTLSVIIAALVLFLT